MIELTVGYVAGFVALGFFIANQLAPNALAFILSWRLHDKSTASTWTIASSAFQQSHWSWLVFSDSTYDHGVSRSVLWASRFIPIMGMLFGIGSIVTPLGLYSTVISGESVVGQFAYAPDTSSFGLGTTPRSNLTWSRACGYGSLLGGPRACPFSDTVIIRTDFPNGTINWNMPYGINLALPEFVKTVYSSGTKNSSTISNFFDINWRRFSTNKDEYYNNGSLYFVGDFRNIKELATGNSFQVVEGLVVDTVDGGIGFRNHSAPTGFPHGVEWEEDLLFAEPETVCVDTNTTLDYTITTADNNLLPEGNVMLTDRGGFVNMNRSWPEVDVSDKQADLHLWKRAYKGAWLLNAYTALYLNITNPVNGSANPHAWMYMNSEINKTFPLSFSNIGVSNLDSTGLGALVISQKFASYLLENENKPPFPNPWKISATNFSVISLLCSGSGNGDYANITNPAVICGQMRSVPQRTNPGHPSTMEDGSQWSQKILVCASAAKAKVKTVAFTHNATDPRLDALKVTGIRDKTYAGGEELPLWGVENTGNVYNQSEIQLIWGMVSDKYATHPNVSTVRARSLYIPGFVSVSTTATFNGGSQNLPGSNFAAFALSRGYTVDPYTSGGRTTQDYSGASDLATWTRWQKLTQDPRTAALIPNLIFTDVAASAVVGAKGALGPGNAAVPGNLPILAVTPSKQVVRYNLSYAVPAFLGAFLLLIILSIALAAAIFGAKGWSRMRRHLQQTSAGRVYTTFLYPDPGVLRMSSKGWSEKFGNKVVDLGGEYPAAQELLVPSTDDKDPGSIVSEQVIYEPQQHQQYQQQPQQLQQQYVQYQQYQQPPAQQHYDAPHAQYHPGLEQTSPHFPTYQTYHSGYAGIPSPSPDPSHTSGYEEPKNVTHHPGLPPSEQQVYQEITQAPPSHQQYHPKEY